MIRLRGRGTEEDVHIEDSADRPVGEGGPRGQGPLLSVGVEKEDAVSVPVLLQDGVGGVCPVHVGVVERRLVPEWRKIEWVRFLNWEMRNVSSLFVGSTVLGPL